MKVLEVISDTNIGGAGVLLVTRLRHSDRSHTETTVLLPKGSALEPRMRALGVSVLLMRGCRDRSSDMRHVFELARIIRACRPDLINCHGCVSARIAATLARVPIRLYTRHCAYPVSRIRRCAIAQAATNLATRLLSHHVIAVADAAKENLVDMGVPPSCISVIVNGAEGLRPLSEDELHAWRERLRMEDGATVIGISARLEPCKDHACFLRAAARLYRDGGKYVFLILGDGSLREQLEQEAVRLGIASSVRFVGFVADVSPYVNLMDIHVNCSIGTETSSLAISEAMSLGIPTVASDFGGNPYMVRDGENGFLYPAGDDRSLAEKIQLLARDRRLYEQVCRGARMRFEHELNALGMTKKAEQLYARLYRERFGHAVTDQADS